MMACATINLTAPSPPAPPVTCDSLYSKWLQVLDPSKPVNVALRHISRETMLSIIQRLMIKDVNVEQAVTEMLIIADKDVKEWDEAHERSYHSGESQEEEEEEEDGESESGEDEDGDGDESDEGRSRERKPTAGGKAPQKAQSKKRVKGTYTLILTTKPTGQNNDPNPKKRQRICFAMCALCEEEFDVALNGRSACRFHDGNPPLLSLFFFILKTYISRRARNRLGGMARSR